MVLALRSMLVQFVALMLIAAFCFGGFLYALWTLSRSQAHFSAGTIAWWMLDLWFGLDASAFHKATQFHQVLGPVMVVTYACLSNTLLLTVLVSILSHTFSTINEDAAAEAMFRKAVSTIEGVKADFFVLIPASYQCSCFMHNVASKIHFVSSLVSQGQCFHDQSNQFSRPSFHRLVRATSENIEYLHVLRNNTISCGETLRHPSATVEKDNNL